MIANKIFSYSVFIIFLYIFVVKKKIKKILDKLFLFYYILSVENKKDKKMLDNQELQNHLEMSGYEPKTTFWNDFSIAERFGIEAVKDTYKRAFDEWKTNIEYLTELTMMINWKMWRWADDKPALSMVYQKIWEELDAWCMDNLKGEDLQYYLRITD